MPESVHPGPTENSTSFANLLSSLTKAARESTNPWDDSDLADDAATISYEQALRAHRRVRVSESEAALPAKREIRAPGSVSSAESSTSSVPKSRKNASITIRLTAAEQAQLHQRAAEAGLTVSAYLRSCIFEAESLRAQVKEALAWMRSATARETEAGSEEQPAVEHRRFRLFPQWSRRQIAGS